MPNSFYPPRRTLMGPGPSDIHPRVLLAMARPTIGHLDPEFIRMMDEIKEMLKIAFHTNNALTLPISAPGSSGMEACFVNLIEPGDKVIVCQNGVFGGRMKENVMRCGGIPVMVEDTWGDPIDVQKVEEMLRLHPDTKVLAFVQAETSTGVASDAQTLAGMARAKGVLSIMDSVTALGGMPVKVDEWGVDAVYSGTQKCLSCVPGLAPVSFSDCATAVIQGRKRPVQSWFLDMNLVMDYWGSNTKRAYHHTAPVNSLYALHESLVILLEEGLENSWQRHKMHHQALRAGLEALGLSFLVAEPYRLPQLNAVRVPGSVDEAALRMRLLHDFNLEIGAGLGPMAGKVWRIGLMGHSCNRQNVLYCLNSLAAVLPGANAQTAIDAALKSYEHAAELMAA